MRMGRTIPPAATPFSWGDILSGLKGWVKGNSELERFRGELKDYFRVKHCFFTSSGKAALTFILKALKDLYPDKDEVLIPAFTCYSVPAAITRAGLKVTLCDIASEGFDFDYKHLKRIISQPERIKKLLAIIPTHMFGVPSDIAKLKEITKQHKITIIEDAAQAMGGQIRNSKLGTLCDAGFFSLGRGKPFSTIEGGIVLTNDSVIAMRLKKAIDNLSPLSIPEILKLLIYSITLRIFLNPYLFWIPKSLPFLKLGETIFDPDFSINRYSSFQAGFSRSWSSRLDHMNTIRRNNTIFWMNSLKALSQIKMDGVVFIRLPLKLKNLKTRKMLMRISDEKGLGISETYPGAIESIKTLGLEDCHCPNAISTVKKLVTLPVHELLKNKDKESILKETIKLF